MNFFSVFSVDDTQTNDPLACPLYRYVREHGGWDGWAVYPLIVTDIERLAHKPARRR